MFYKKEYQACLTEKNEWRERCFSLTDDLIALRQDVRKLRGLCDWLENENGRLRKKEAFTFDKAEFQRLENENRELKKRIRALEMIVDVAFGTSKFNRMREAGKYD